MYHCPHCDEGPFSAADWWDHVGLHNAPWLQSRDPQNLERTDLGYGEDIQGMTTVPTHDMPNEPGFNPEKFGAIEPHKKLWPGGWKLHTSWLYNRGTGELVSSFSHGENAQYHYQMFENGLLPGIDEDDLYDPDIYRRLALGHLYKTTEDGKTRWSLAYGSDAADPDFEDEQQQLTPAEKEDIRNQFNEHLKDYKEGSWKEATLPDVPPHRMVWLSQPNNTSLKYWHHNPSNVTYAWDATGASQTTKRHHLDAADDIAANHGGNHPLGSPDWEGGFYEQNEMGRHPADLWGLPSQVDYAPVQGGY